MTDLWQHLPQHLDPVAFVIGPFSVRWYAICFITGYFALVTSLLRRSSESVSRFDRDTVLDAAVWTFLGVLAGGRLGFALFYEPSLFANPLSLVWPTDTVTGTFSGIRGMSFFGALIGTTIVFFKFTKAKRISFFGLTDFVVPSVPIALFFGRMGNFLNLELPGRLTSVPWGVYFPTATDGAWDLRHPSQIYEAFLEGVVLFVVLSVLRKRRLPKGVLSLVFLSGYGVVRFFVEFFRDPDPGATLHFGWMTAGQALSLMLLAIAAVASMFLLGGTLPPMDSEER